MKLNLTFTIDAGILACSILGVISSAMTALWGLLVLADFSASVPRALTNSNIIAMFVVGMLFVWRHQWLTKGISPEEIGRSRYRGCPSWMRFTSYALMSIGVALFAFSLLLEYFGIAPAGNGTTMPPTISGGFGLMAYSAFFSQLYSAKGLYQRG